ncbi:MAG: flagellin FliC [Deltaproteobacteria bacterium]|nr:flagellin FliC [Deltaproteobacteria bacterium]
MALIINTNAASLDAQRTLGITQRNLAQSFQRLSSGFRINAASDDAAGLGVSESLKARIRSFRVAERNTNNAIGMTRTAEGGLGEISGIVQRMRELAVQSANGDLTSTDRSYIDTEFQLLKDEIDRVANSTDFNGVALLSGTAADIRFQVGIGTTPNDTIDISFGGISTTNLGLTSGVSLDGTDATNATAAIDAIDAALTSVSTSRATFGAAQNRLSISVTNSQTMRTNLEAANSSIRDVDIAEETSILARSQVLLQAGTSVLAQANQAPQLALQLLG